MLSVGKIRSGGTFFRRGVVDLCLSFCLLGLNGQVVVGQQTTNGNKQIKLKEREREIETFDTVTLSGIALSFCIRSYYVLSVFKPVKTANAYESLIVCSVVY